MGKYNDFKNDHAVVSVSGGDAVTKTSPTLNTAGMEQATVILSTGTIIATGTLDVKIEHSVDDSVWADLPGAVFSQKVTADEDGDYLGIIKCNQVGVNQYLRISSTAAVAVAEHGCVLIAQNLSGHLPLVTNALPAPEFDILPPTGA